MPTLSTVRPGSPPSSRPSRPSRWRRRRSGRCTRACCATGARWRSRCSDRRSLTISRSTSTCSGYSRRSRPAPPLAEDARLPPSKGPGRAYAPQARSLGVLFESLPWPRGPASGHLQAEEGWSHPCDHQASPTPSTSGPPRPKTSCSRSSSSTRRDLATISPRSRRDLASISPRSRHDLAAISPRSRHDLATICTAIFTAIAP